MPNSPGRRLAPHLVAALAAAFAGAPSGPSAPGRWVTPLRMRVALLGESIK